MQCAQLSCLALFILHSTLHYWCNHHLDVFIHLSRRLSYPLYNPSLCFCTQSSSIHGKGGGGQPNYKSFEVILLPYLYLKQGLRGLKMSPKLLRKGCLSPSQ